MQMTICTDSSKGHYWKLDLISSLVFAIAMSGTTEYFARSGRAEGRHVMFAIAISIVGYLSAYCLGRKLCHRFSHIRSFYMMAFGGALCDTFLRSFESFSTVLSHKL